MKFPLRPLAVAALLATSVPLVLAEAMPGSMPGAMPATAPTTKPVYGDPGAGDATMLVIPASDTAALKAAVGKQVMVTGTVKSAEWSRSGKVMAMQFEGADAEGFQAVIFEKSRKAMDAQYAGDVAKAVVGRKVQVKGRMQMYAGRLASKEGRPEMVLSRDSQLTIVEDAPTTMPTTKPAE